MGSPPLTWQGRKLRHSWGEAQEDKLRTPGTVVGRLSSGLDPPPGLHGQQVGTVGVRTQGLSCWSWAHSRLRPPVPHPTPHPCWESSFISETKGMENASHPRDFSEKGIFH